MKIFLFAFLLLMNFGYCQTHKAVYSFKIEANPITGNTQLKDDVGPLAEGNEYYLYFDKEHSYYTSYNVENHTKDMSDAIGGSYYPVKYNYATKILQYNTEFDEMYVLNDNNIPVWTITNETKEISGYTCIKATGIYKDIINSKKSYPIEAWFTPELAYPIGPYQNVGLPGLVVYAVFNNFQIYKLEKIKFNDNTIDIDAITFEGAQLSEERYVEFLKQDLNY